MRVNRNIRLLEANAAITGMMFVVPVLVPFYRDQMGLSFDDFLIGEAFFAATIVALDVPMGWLSDVWKRKHVLALGSLIEAFGHLLLQTAHSLMATIISQIVIGVGITLLSGTNTATLYESLMSGGREDEYRRHEGRRSGIGLYCIAGASVVGSLVYPYCHSLPAAATAIVQGIGVILSVMLDEPERHRKKAEKHPVLDMIETGRYALRHAEVGILLMFAAMMFCSTKLIMWSQQPYYMAIGLKEVWFGVLMACGFFLGGFSSHIAHHFDGKANTQKVLIGVWLAAIAACLIAASHLGWFGVAVLMIGGSCLYGIANPRVSETINRHVDPARRATVLSTQSLLVSLLFIPLSRIMGLVSKAHGVQGMLLSLALWLALAGACLALYKRRGIRD
jgi:MFS family permease